MKSRKKAERKVTVIRGRKVIKVSPEQVKAGDKIAHQIFTDKSLRWVPMRNRKHDDEGINTPVPEAA